MYYLIYVSINVKSQTLLKKYTAQCTLHTAPAHAPASAPIHVILHTEHYSVHHSFILHFASLSLYTANFQNMPALDYIFKWENVP